MSPSIPSQSAELHRWRNVLDELIAQVSRWATERDWSIRRIEKRLEDRELGRHLVPALLLQKETTRILLEPISRKAAGADGVVDLYLMPAYDDIARIYHESDGWKLHCSDHGEDSAESNGEAASKPFTEETFADVIEEMVRNAISAG